MSIPLPSNVDVSFGNKDVPWRRVVGSSGQLDGRKNQCGRYYSVVQDPRTCSKSCCNKALGSDVPVELMVEGNTV